MTIYAIAFILERIFLRAFEEKTHLVRSTDDAFHCYLYIERETNALPSLHGTFALLKYPKEEKEEN
ncbi:MAG: hypothetical protein O7D30_04950 [Rickettsia endosymbiont of Ixodes persulcatus]|nr:hypothetical protein [Rickettsia endosymbiont of Ixodes persulcatus]